MIRNLSLFKPEPIKFLNSELPIDICSLIDLLTENYHALECRNLMKNGYVYGPVNINSKLEKTSNTLMPFMFLSDNEKDKYRELLLQIINGALSCGYKINHNEYYNESIFEISQYQMYQDVKEIQSYKKLLYNIYLRSACRLNLLTFIPVLLTTTENLSADVDCVDFYNHTPLYLAVKRGNVEIVKKLINYNANVNIKDNNGLTPLMLASSLGNIELVYILLEQDADIKIKDNRGLTAM